MHRIFLVSPASCVGKRADLLLRERASFDLATRLRSPAGVPLGDVFAFLSGLYFRGKLAYARAFACPPARLPGVYVITTSRGLVLPEQPVRIDDLREFATVDLHAGNARYRTPLARDVAWVAERLRARAEIVLLGSVASAKYVDVLADLLGEQLRFPIDFVGRGDMSRGGLMLRCVRARTELAYVPLAGAPRHGARPPKLPRLPRTG
ncbi:MAG TPA: hypothetical protein VKU61_04925 [Candidatus Binatia bacterium]|nr:hypothetical protein [Candidatus Binatia bacterium]